MDLPDSSKPHDLESTPATQPNEPIRSGSKGPRVRSFSAQKRRASEPDQDVIVPFSLPESNGILCPDFVFPSLVDSHSRVETATPPVTAAESASSHVMQSISGFIEKELQGWRENHQGELKELQQTSGKLVSKAERVEKEYNKLVERNLLLSKRIDLMRAENDTLRDTIGQLQTILSGGTESSIAASLNSLKEKLWEGTLQINPQKTQHINLLKRLTATRFNPSNEKHIALLQKFLLHHGTDMSTASQFGFGGETDSSILALQNLVYFSERYNQLARKLNNNSAISFPRVGISITTMLTSVLHLTSGNSEILPASDISKTFVRLMDHPKAFEELYCVCFRLYDKAMTAGNSDPLKITEQQIMELLNANPENLQSLIDSAEKM